MSEKDHKILQLSLFLRKCALKMGEGGRGRSWKGVCLSPSLSIASDHSMHLHTNYKFVAGCAAIISKAVLGGNVSPT